MTPQSNCHTNNSGEIDDEFFAIGMSPEFVPIRSSLVRAFDCYRLTALC